MPRRNGRFFFGWIVVAAGAGVEFTVGVLLQQVLGGYAAALTREFGWSRGSIGLGFSLSRLENGILGPAQGWLIDRFGPRAIIRAGLVILAIGFALFSLVDSLVGFYLAIGVMTMGAGIAAFMPVTVAVVHWFDRSRARALGLAQVGTAVAGLLAPLVILAITGLGWRQVALASSVAVLALGLPASTFVRGSPAEMGLRVDGLSEAEEARRREADRVAERPVTSTAIDFSAREALRSRAFWLVSLGHASALFVVSAVSVHIFLHLTGSLGYSDVQAAVFLGVMTLSQIVGQVTGGFLGDRVNKRVIAVVAMGMHAAGLLLVAHVGTIPGVLGWAILHGTAWGARGPLMAAIRADYFGRSSFGTIMGFSSIITMVGAVGGPFVAGVLYDATGSYAAGFTVIATLAACGSAFFVFATRPAHPRNATVRTANG